MSLPSTYNGNYTESEESTIVYNYDWSKTSLGSMDTWDPIIKNAVNLCLQSVFPIGLFLGPEWIVIYNKAFRPLIIEKNSFVIGKSIKGSVSVSDYLISLFENVRTTGKGIFQNDQFFELQCDGYKTEMYYSYTFSPILKSDGTFFGIICLAQNTAQRVVNARRLKTISEFGHWTSEIDSLESACNIMKKILKDNNVDIPYALVYFIEHKLNISSEYLTAHLKATTFDEDGKKERHFPDYFPETHEIIDLSQDIDKNYGTYVELKRESSTYSFLTCKSWPIHLLMKEGGQVKVLLKDESQAVLLLTKIPFSDGRALSVIFIYGINRLCVLDEEYMKFLHLVTNQMNSFLFHGRSIEEEKMRSKILADLNHQKVTFFQGISHELKTPLTLMLSPLDDVINTSLPEAPIMSYLQTIKRNTYRLLKLIKILLQFSNIDANQFEAQYRETNIAKFTRESASDFKSMAKTLGLNYIIDIPDPDEFNRAVGDKVYLDHNMYETIVFNLCSNALKHTWKGCITIRLYLDYKDKKKMVVLEVSDTGVGIPEVALPDIFRRFYRVESQSSRSQEGTGIGLALVKELITQHGGDITVASKVNQGTTFKCWFLIGYEHLPKNQIRFNNVENPLSNDQDINRQLYLEESSQWTKDNIYEAKDDIVDNGETLKKEITYTENPVTGQKHRVLIVDNCNDMRDYLAVLLKEFEIFLACDGQDALRVLKKLNKLPELILSGKSNTETQLIPIILLSAKSDEDSKIKGLDKGADDYLIKPFSTQELITRVRVNIELSLLRHKIIFQQYKEEETKQLLLSISTKMFSGLNMKETLQYAVEEINKRLPCKRIFITSNEQIGFNSSKIIALYENSENSSMEICDYENKSQIFMNSQEFLKNNLRIQVYSDVYSDDVCENVSILSAELRLNNNLWGWMKIYRSPNSIWLDSEIEFLHQILNQVCLTITYISILEENIAKEIQIKAAEVASTTKSQILANTSHELRTPLGAIIGILSSLEDTNLTSDQENMINIMKHSSDIVLSIVNDILDAQKLEAQKLTLVNRTFNLLELFDNVIEMFGEKACAKKIELIIDYDVDELPRYVKSDPERVKFTEKGEIILTISILSQNVLDEANVDPTSVKKKVFLFELYDTGIGMSPEYIQHAWESFSQGDMSITKKQDGVGLGLAICKHLIEMNGGEIKAESQLGKGSKFWFTWNVELLSPMTSSPLLKARFNEKIGYTLPNIIRKKRILIIHPVESMRNSISKYFKNAEKVDAFDIFDKGIKAARTYKELYNQSAYDLAFINLYENNKEEVMKIALELRKLDMNSNNLVIIFIVFPTNEEIALAKRFIRKIGGTTSVIYTPITWKKLIKQFID
ncbi:hypothetical protein C2G38_2253571 [Gigaspora rosea]|uniref:histidine kinase n=1 Tax=Gigaspora rosea TaxID=44941 RepID=A0A397U6C9_9GLOM|nr:hypothetical protein C2G38_2253571 [Gigaspora rosea]